MEHERAGCDMHREYIGDGSHVTVRLHRHSHFRRHSVNTCVTLSSFRVDIM